MGNPMQASMGNAGQCSLPALGILCAQWGNCPASNASGALRFLSKALKSFFFWCSIFFKTGFVSLATSLGSNPGQVLPALVLETAPPTIRILSSQALVAVFVLRAVLDSNLLKMFCERVKHKSSSFHKPHLGQRSVCHDIDVVPLEVKEQVGPDRGALRDGNVRVLDARAGRLDDGLPQPAVPGAEEGHREVSC